jgi:hypothetical protein
MSLWTPSGEHPVDRPGRSSAAPRQQEQQAEARGPVGPGLTEEDLAGLSPEERAQVEAMAEQVEDARRQMLAAPAGPVVGQQALQFYELAALHLSQPEPRLDDARIAIDALGAVVEGLGSRLGAAESPLRQALDQLRVAYVEVAGRTGGPTDGTPPGEPGPGDG